MANKPKVGDVGTIIELDMQESVASAVAHSEETDLVFIVVKPSGAEVKWVCTIYNTNYFRYTVVSGDLNEASEDFNGTSYLITPKFALGDWEGHGDTVKMYVYGVSEI